MANIGTRARYIPTVRRDTAGGSVEQGYQISPNPSSLDQMYGVSNFSWPTTIIAFSPGEGVDYPFFTRFLEGSPYPKNNYWQKIQAGFGAALNSAYNLSWWNTLQVANGGGGWNDIIQTGNQSSSSVYAYGAFQKRRNAAYAATHTALPDGLGAWIFAIPAAEYSVQVCQLLDEIQYHLMENPNGGISFDSGLWSAAEVLVYLNNRISRFLMETGCMQFRVQQLVTDTEFQNLPEDLIDLRRVAWDDGFAGISGLARGDSLQADLANATPWETPGVGVPAFYVQIPEESLEIRLVPNPGVNAPGDPPDLLDIIYVKDFPAVTNDCSIMPIPDEWCPFVKWGVIADMLAKEGEGNDPKRAQYAEQRYQDGVQLARLYIGTKV